MESLLNAFDLKTIILVLFLTAVGIKELIELYHYFHNKIYGRYEKQDNQNDTIENLTTTLGSVLQQVKDINKKINMLQASDRDAMKSWIVTLYHKYKENPKQLGSMQMDLLERRYRHYKDQGGNSYIDQLMEDLRAIYKEKGESHVSV